MSLISVPIKSAQLHRTFNLLTSYNIIIIIIRHAPCQCVALLATNSLHSDLSKASSIATFTYKALHTGNPPYLASLLHRHNPCRALRSASANILSVTRSNLSFGSRAFRAAAPTVWKSPTSCPLMYYSHNIPKTFKITSFSIFLSYCLATHPSTSDSFSTLALCEIYLFTYLLTYSALEGKIVQR